MDPEVKPSQDASVISEHDSEHPNKPTQDASVISEHDGANTTPNGGNAPNGHPKRMSPSRSFMEEAGDLNNSHNNITNNHKTVEQINITLAASTGSTPPQSPRQEVKDWKTSPTSNHSPSSFHQQSHQQSPQQRVASDETRARATSSPATIGEQLSSAFTPVTQAFARLSTLASESPLINSLKSSPSTSSTNSTDSNGGPSFWKRKGKVPGSVKPARPESQKPHGFMARPPTPPHDENPRATSPFPPLSPSSSDNDLQRHANGYGNDNPPSDLHRSDGFDYEHHCQDFKSCGSRLEQTARMDKFTKILSENVVDLEALKKLCWTGIPGEVRAQCWKLLLGYLPANADRRETTLQRKRKEYFDCIPQYYDVPDEDRNDTELKIFRQIQIDVPRTNPNMGLFQQPEVQKLLERILYIWAIRHPASGYVQGINDLATPFFVVFLSELVENIDVCDVSTLPPEKIRLVEADSYWCMSKLLDGIQDHYTFAQPGLQRMTHKLKELVGRIDAPLSRHLGEQDAQFIQFAFRWMNCLLMREIPLPLICRMWDTYLAEGPTHGFGVFHVYVCAAFLVTWSEDLRQREFQDIMLFLQRLPTLEWHCKDVELLLSQAFIWMSVFQNAPSHLK